MFHGALNDRAMIKLKSIIQHLPEFERLNSLVQKQNVVTLQGVYGSLISLIIDYLSQTNDAPILALCPDSDNAEKLADDLKSCLPDNFIAYLPPDEVVPFDKGVFTPSIYSERLNGLLGILSREVKIVITTAPALAPPAPFSGKFEIKYGSVEPK